HDVLFAHRAGHADRGRVLHVGVGENLGLDLEGGYILPAPADRILLAVDEIVIAHGGATETVSGMEPAIAPRRSRRLRHAPIARRNRPRPVSPQDQLAALP